MGLLKLKHSHLDPFTKQPSMSESLKCKECGEQVARAFLLYQRYRKTNPEMFVYKEPELPRSKELERSYELLADRTKKDSLYKEHIRKLAHGTEAEKDEEIKKVNNKYYQTHYAEKDGGIRKI